MRERRGGWGKRGIWVGIAVLIAQGCGANSQSRSDTAGAGTGGGDSAAGRGLAAAAGVSGAFGGSVSTASTAGFGDGGSGSGDHCPERPSPLRTVGSRVSLPLRFVLQGKPLLFGEENTLDDRSSLVPINVRFYVSEVMLQPVSGAPLPVDLVSATGSALPYGVHFYNAEQAESGALHLLAPAGDYTGLSFLVGLKLDCNRRSPENSSEPLTQSSQMTWPHTGYLFLRYEARFTPAASGPDSGGSSGYSGAGGAESAGLGAGSPSGSSAGSGAAGPLSLPTAIHMGGDLLREVAPRVNVLGAFSVPASGTVEKPLRVVMDEVFRAATSALDPIVQSPALEPPTFEVEAGDRLRHALPTAAAFTFEP